MVAKKAQLQAGQAQAQEFFAQVCVEDECVQYADLEKGFASFCDALSWGIEMAKKMINNDKEKSAEIQIWTFDEERGVEDKEWTFSYYYDYMLKQWVYEASRESPPEPDC